VATIEVDGVLLRQERKRLWIGDVISQRFGHMEAVLDGTADAPKEEHVSALHRFFQNLDSNISRLRSKIRFGFLYRPIRIAPNMENIVGVQFRNRFTGNQSLLIQEEKKT
jgi:hypothetical protein